MQANALEWLQDQTTRVRLIEAPPGIGKTLLAAMWAYNQDRPVCILTATLSLLSQYEAMGIPVIRGRANFRCQYGGTCDDGSEEDCSPEICPYLKAKLLAMRAPVRATTYATYLADLRVRLGSPVIVCDEGQRVDDLLSVWYGVSLTIPPKTNPQPPRGTSLVDWRIWAKDARPWEHTPGAYGRTKKLLKKLQSLEDRNDWVTTYSNHHLLVRPLWPDQAWQLAMSTAQTILIQSATLYGGHFFAKMLGINDYSILSLDSPFNADQRPVHIIPVANLNYRSSDDDWLKIGRACADIIHAAGNTKGLIHVSSRFQVERLHKMFQDLLPTTQMLYHILETRDKRQQLFDSFRQLPSPAWLISPSAFEGEDFLDDQLRVQIIAKVRYGDMSDPLVKARVEYGPRGKMWYYAKAVADTCQGVGRAMRSDLDWGTTYILDAQIQNLLRYHRELWPKYVLEAIVK